MKKGNTEVAENQSDSKSLLEPTGTDVVSFTQKTHGSRFCSCVSKNIQKAYTNSSYLSFFIPLFSLCSSFCAGSHESDAEKCREMEIVADRGIDNEPKRDVVVTGNRFRRPPYASQKSNQKKSAALFRSLFGESLFWFVAFTLQRATYNLYCCFGTQCRFPSLE